MSLQFENYPIEIDGNNSQDYEKKIVALLKKISSNSIGKIILDSFPKNKTLLIRPKTEDICSADTFPNDVTTFLSAQNKGATIKLSPDKFAVGTECNPIDEKRKFGMDQDEVLLHELVHANRIMRDNWEVNKKIPKEDGFDYENIEDFLAITLVNVYSSSNGKTEFRLDHAKPTGAAKIPDKISPSDVFLSQPVNYKYLQYLFVKDNPLFILVGQQRQIKFNPFFEYLKVRRSYISFSYN